jgi:hypothetical protein
MSSEKAAPPCTECRWFDPPNRTWPGGCANRSGTYAVAKFERRVGACGPIAKNFKPKDQP